MTYRTCFYPEGVFVIDEPWDKTGLIHHGGSDCTYHLLRAAWD